MQNYIVTSTDKTNNPDKFALFIGRWQPFHGGHQWLIDQKLNEGKRVCIAIRDVPQDDKNWWSSEEIQGMLEDGYLPVTIAKTLEIPITWIFEEIEQDELSPFETINS